jgi:uncharacterized membrane protein YhaH (DUF805 family)
MHWVYASLWLLFIFYLMRLGPCPMTWKQIFHAVLFAVFVSCLITLGAWYSKNTANKSIEEPKKIPAACLEFAK